MAVSPSSRRVVTLLVRNRLLLFGSLALLGAAIGVTAHILSPDGLVRARHPAWGPGGAAPVGEVAGLPSDRFGRECGLEAHGRRRALPGCHAYQAPAIVRVGDRTMVVWEQHDESVAVSELGPDLSLDRTVRFERPRTERGVLLPRTGVGVHADRLAIRYYRGQVITVGADLAVWPGGALEVASARIGPRGGILAGGVLGLLALYFGVAGWTLGLPSLLRRRAREGRCLSVRVPERGSTIVLDGHAVELDLDRTWVFGMDRSELPGREVTLVLPSEQRSSAQGYRARDRLAPLQAWPGKLDEALARAKALRDGTVALAVGATAVLLLGLDAYLIW